MSKHQNKSGSTGKRAGTTRSRHPGSEKRPRYHTIFLDINRPNVSVVLGRPDQGIPLTFIDTTTGEPIDDLGPKTVEAGVTYTRENKGPKTITRFGTSADTAGINPNRKLLEYDHIFAVDTNTDPSSGKSVSVLVWLANLRHEADGWKIDPRFPAAFVFRGPSGRDPEPNPEKIGWRDAIERITQSPDFQGRIALFVDSYMNEIPAINARELPIAQGFLLPDGITLLYATSDTGADEFAGPAAIKLCDRTATRLMKLTRMPASPGQPFHFPIPAEALATGGRRRR